MPRNGFSTITFPDALRDNLQAQADDMGLTIPEMLSHLHGSPSDPKAIPLKATPSLVEVSTRAYRTIMYASKVYSKPPSIIVEKLIDAPLNAIPLTPSTHKRVLPPKPDLLKQGLQLLRDVSPQKAQECKDALAQVGHGRSMPPPQDTGGPEESPRPFATGDAFLIDCPEEQRKVHAGTCEVCKAKDFQRWKACQEYQQETNEAHSYA